MSIKFGCFSHPAQVVGAFADIRVQVVGAFPDSAGKWRIVTSFPRYRVQIVNAFADYKITYVNAFPGVS